MWFKLRGDARLGRCTSENCGGQPTFRLEAGGIGSDYCSGCRENIEALERYLMRVVQSAANRAATADITYVAPEKER